MRYHPSLTRQAVEDCGPFLIAQMIANEFKRASQKAESLKDAIQSYHRARELMGVLETIELEESVALNLQPFYRLCSLRELFQEERLRPFFIKHFAAFVAKAFMKTALHLHPQDLMDPRQGHSGMTA